MYSRCMILQEVSIYKNRALCIAASAYLKLFHVCQKLLISFQKFGAIVLTILTKLNVSSCNLALRSEVNSDELSLHAKGKRS